MRYGMVVRSGLAAMAVGCLVVTGCATSGSADAEPRGMNYRADLQARVYDNQLKIVERATGKVDGLLDVTMGLQNLTPADVSLEYRFIWRTAAGVVAETPTTPWQPARIPASGKQALKGRAPTPDATDFLLSLRAIR